MPFNSIKTGPKEKLLTFNGKTQGIKQWAEELRIPNITIRGRIKRGWPIEKVLSKKRFWLGNPGNIPWNKGKGKNKHA